MKNNLFDLKDLRKLKKISKYEFLKPPAKVKFYKFM